MSLADRLAGPSARFLLGTDHVGRDLLTRLIYGARVSLTVGLAATALNVVVALLIGGTSGFLGGKLDLAVQRFVDAWVSIPGLLILLTIMSIVGRGLAQTIVVLGVTGGIGGSRVVRSAVIAIKENAYFQAAEAIGSSRSRTLMWHVVPNRAGLQPEHVRRRGERPARPAAEGWRGPPRPRAGETTPSRLSPR